MTNTFVMTNMCLSQQQNCHDKIILVASPADETIWVGLLAPRLDFCAHNADQGTKLKMQGEERMCKTVKI